MGRWAQRRVRGGGRQTSVHPKILSATVVGTTVVLVFNANATVIDPTGFEDNDNGATGVSASGAGMTWTIQMDFAAVAGDGWLAQAGLTTPALVAPFTGLLV